MRKISLQFCGFTCIMGIFGAFLRWVQTQTVFDSETLLAAPYSPWSFAVILFALFGSVMIFIWVHSLKKYSAPQKYPEVFALGLPIFPIVAGIIGIVMAIGGVVTLIQALSITKFDSKLFEILLGFLTIPCAGCLASFIINTNKTDKKSNGVFNSVVIVVYLCFWLIAAYKHSASDPVIWHFAPRLMAISITILAFYFIAGYVFNKPKPLASMFFSLLGVFLCIITLADSYPIGEQLIVLSLAVSMLLLSFAQLNNMRPES